MSAWMERIDKSVDHFLAPLPIYLGLPIRLLYLGLVGCLVLLQLAAVAASCYLVVWLFGLITHWIKGHP